MERFPAPASPARAHDPAPGRRSVARRRRPRAPRLRLGLPREPAPALPAGQEASARLGGRSPDGLLGDVSRPRASLDRAAALHPARRAPRAAPRSGPDRALERALLDVAGGGDGAVLARAVPSRALLAAGAPRRRVARGAWLAAAARGRARSPCVALARDRRGGGAPWPRPPGPARP